MKKILIALSVLLSLQTVAQVKIGDNPNTINANSLLEMESTNKGFLPPRVALNSLTSVSPLTGTVPSGMLVYSSGGSMSDGYYYWDGTEWTAISNGKLNVVSKTATATLTKSETFVLASNDITITLPVVTSADNGLSITVKNTGAHTDLVTVEGNSATIDDLSQTLLPRNMGQTFVATDGNWAIKEATKFQQELMNVGEQGSWTTIQEAIEFLESHMTGPVVIRLNDESYELDETINIDLPYALTIQGSSFSTSTIGPATGLTGKPMFRCISDCYFKMLQFDATTLADYGTLAGEDALRFVGSGTYNEVKDSFFESFYNAIVDSTNAELWVFECDIFNSNRTGILIHSNVAGTVVKVAETDFIDCARGIDLSKSNGATIQLSSGGYYNANSTDSAIIYRPATFVSSASISIKGNLWNTIGKYIEGFDFTRSDGRDANTILESNAGIGDKNPYCFINVLNSTTIKTLTSSNTWYKADWGANTSSQTCKWSINNNRITYQPTNRRNGTFTIAGNLSVDNNNRVISIGIVKNGNSAVRYGETSLRITTSNQPFQFSFVVYLEDMAPGDYFEIYYSSANNGDEVKIQDIQWLVNAH